VCRVLPGYVADEFSHPGNARKEIELKIQRSIKYLLPLLLLVLVSAGVTAQKLTSLTATAKGQGTINVSDIDKHTINSLMIVLKENGDAEFTFYADLQLSAQGSWSAGTSLSKGIDIKITGGVVADNAKGSGKLFLRQDGKSIDRLTFAATTDDGSKITINFVADKTAAKSE
jgi:hypothetical protein